MNPLSSEILRSGLGILRVVPPLRLDSYYGMCRQLVSYRWKKEQSEDKKDAIKPLQPEPTSITAVSSLKGSASTQKISLLGKRKELEAGVRFKHLTV